jgi:putative ABC transport system permease protein
MEPRRFRIISVKTRPGALLSSMDHFKKVWGQYITNRPLHYYFLDDRLEYGYRNERRYQNILAVSFGLAIFIACLGLTGLATYTAERRTKEIGIRKALGASVPKIITLLSLEFVQIIALANLAAWPFAWYTMSEWLKGFAFRIDLGVFPFIGAAILSIGFAMATVGSQAYRAAKTNPIDALRYE